MESIDYFPSGQMYQNTEHEYNHKCVTPIYACTQRIDLIKVNSLIFYAEW